jgi:hypothetical protein
MAAVGRGSNAPPAPEAAVRVESITQDPGSNPEVTNAGEGRLELEFADLRQQVALLKSEVARIQRQWRQRAYAAAQVRRSATPTGTAAPADAVVGSAQESHEHDAKTMAREHQQSLARMAAGEAALQRETPSDVWSVQATEALREALASEEFAATTVHEIDCRSTLCRLQVVHEDPIQQALFQNSFTFKVGPLLPKMMMHTDELGDGTISATLYLAREGHALPRAD